MSPKHLRKTVVRRSGQTARYWTNEPTAVRLRVDHGDGTSALILSFKLNSKGGGRTEVEVEVGPEDFADVVSAMADRSRAAAMTAMTTELAKQVAAQAEFDGYAAARARQDMVNLAKQKVEAAGDDDRDAKTLVHKQVRRLAQELEDAAEAAKKDREGEGEVA